MQGGARRNAPGAAPSEGEAHLCRESTAVPESALPLPATHPSRRVTHLEGLPLTATQSGTKPRDAPLAMGHRGRREARLGRACARVYARLLSSVCARAGDAW